MNITINENFTYRALYLAAAHLSVQDLETLQRLANEPKAYYVNNVDAARASILVRLVGIDSDWSGIEETLKEDGLSADLLEAVQALHDQGIEALHFDPDMDIVQGMPWYADNHCKITPLGYDIPVIGFDDLTDEQRGEAVDTWGQDGAEVSNYFHFEGNAYCMADCITIQEGQDHYASYNGYFDESYHSRVLVELVDDGEAVNLARETA